MGHKTHIHINLLTFPRFTWGGLDICHDFSTHETNKKQPMGSDAQMAFGKKVSGKGVNLSWENVPRKCPRDFLG